MGRFWNTGRFVVWIGANLNHHHQWFLRLSFQTGKDSLVALVQNAILISEPVVREKSAFVLTASTVIETLHSLQRTNFTLLIRFGNRLSRLSRKSAVLL